MGCDMWDPDTPQQIYNSKVASAMNDYGFVNIGRDNLIVCQRCGCYIFAVETHLLACSVRSQKDRDEFLEKIASAEKLIIEATVGVDPSIKDDIKGVIAKRFGSKYGDQFRITGMRNRNDVLVACTLQGEINAFDFKLALEKLTKRGSIFVQDYFSGVGSHYQDSVVVNIE